MISSCNTTTTNKIIRVAENKRIFRIINDSSFQINKVKVDDCYIKNVLRCDYLFEIIEKMDVSIVFYVELKGSDINHAIEQLEATIQYCLNEHNRVNKKECYIVASKFPSAGTSSQVLRKKFFKKNKIQLFIGTKKTDVTI